MTENKITIGDAVCIGVSFLIGGYLCDNYVFPAIYKAKAELKSSKNIEAKVIPAGNSFQQPKYAPGVAVIGSNGTKYSIEVKETLKNVYDDKCLDNLPNIEQLRSKKE